MPSVTTVSVGAMTMSPVHLQMHPHEAYNHHKPEPVLSQPLHAVHFDTLPGWHHRGRPCQCRRRPPPEKRVRYESNRRPTVVK